MKSTAASTKSPNLAIAHYVGIMISWCRAKIGAGCAMRNWRRKMTTKNHLYEPLLRKQDGFCACGCGEKLHEDRYQNHIDRIKEGGEYALANCRLLRRECHMRQHGIEANSPFVRLRTAFKNYRLWQRQRCRYDLALKGAWTTPYSEPVTLMELERQVDAALEHEKYFEKQIAKELRQLGHPIVQALLDLKGTGPITAGMLLSRVDISKAEYPSSLWKFFGLAGPTNERYEDGKKGGGSKEDRAILRQWAESQIKHRTPYRRFYDERRERTNKEEHWKSDAHRMADALRVMTKMFLSHFWEVYRKMEGLPVPEPYAMNHLNHDGYVSPQEMGWLEI
jgi:hypothetical protein